MKTTQGIKGACLFCDHCKVAPLYASCHYNKAYNATGRTILKNHLSDEERMKWVNNNRATYKEFLYTTKRRETVEKLSKKTNPSWCPLRKED